MLSSKEHTRQKGGSGLHRFYYSRIKKGKSQGKKCHSRAMMHSEVVEACKMNTHHVPFRQSVEETRC